MKKVRTAVVGVGHFGSRHAAIYAALPDCELVAVADIDAARADAIAQRHGTRALADYRALADSVDAVSVVVPTADHHAVARFFLDNGVHVLVEKPIARRVEEADDLIARARASDLVLQVGHLERFFVDEIGLAAQVYAPLYIESQRIAPFGQRGTDVSVVLDLMIHDIDLIASLVREPVEYVDAIGAPVLSGEPDIVNTRLKFANGCVANMVASRIATKRERRLRIFQPDSMISVDLLERRVTTASRNAEAAPLQAAVILCGFGFEERSYGESDPLRAELASFVDAVAHGRAPLVGGADGCRALDTANRITESLEAHLAKVRAHMPHHAVTAGTGSSGPR